MDTSKYKIGDVIVADMDYAWNKIFKGDRCQIVDGAPYCWRITKLTPNENILMNGKWDLRYFTLLKRDLPLATTEPIPVAKPALEIKIGGLYTSNDDKVWKVNAIGVDGAIYCYKYNTTTNTVIESARSTFGLNSLNRIVSEYKPTKKGWIILYKFHDGDIMRVSGTIYGNETAAKENMDKMETLAHQIVEITYEG